jgi:hypothetical protein
MSMDIAALFARHVLRLPTGRWDLMGRWFGYWFKGTLVHRPISESEPIAHELAIGWIGHYVTGIIYGIAYLGVVENALAAEPSIETALVFGLVTLAAPWLFVQPSIGVGVFASNAPHPWVIRLTNVAMHMAFGASLYIGWGLLG